MINFIIDVIAILIIWVAIGYHKKLHPNVKQSKIEMIIWGIVIGVAAYLIDYKL